MKRLGHWLSLLGLVISLVWSPAASAMVASRHVPHGATINTASRDVSATGVLFAERSLDGDGTQGLMAASPDLFVEIPHVPLPDASAASPVALDLRGAVRAVALERPLSCGPPALD